MIINAVSKTPINMKLIKQVDTLKESAINNINKSTLEINEYDGDLDCAYFVLPPSVSQSSSIKPQPFISRTLEERHSEIVGFELVCDNNLEKDHHQHHQKVITIFNALAAKI
jgi:hypothetical protein